MRGRVGGPKEMPISVPDAYAGIVSFSTDFDWITMKMCHSAWEKASRRWQVDSGPDAMPREPVAQFMEVFAGFVVAFQPH